MEQLILQQLHFYGTKVFPSLPIIHNNQEFASISYV